MRGFTSVIKYTTSLLCLFLMCCAEDVPDIPDALTEEEFGDIIKSLSTRIPIGTRNLLVAAVYNSSLGSSDECLVIQLETNGTILVNEGHRVKYFLNQTHKNLAGVTDWMMPGYDDSVWKNGFNGVGYDSIETTAVPDTGDQGAIFSRFESFGIPNAESVPSLTIRADYDDGFVVWLNGVEVVRANMWTYDAVPEWNHYAIWHESTNIVAPDSARWDAPVSNLFGAGDGNPDGSIVEFSFAVTFDPEKTQ